MSAPLHYDYYGNLITPSPREDAGEDRLLAAQRRSDARGLAAGKPKKGDVVDDEPDEDELSGHLPGPGGPRLPGPGGPRLAAPGFTDPSDKLAAAQKRMTERMQAIGKPKKA